MTQKASNRQQTLGPSLAWWWIAGIVCVMAFALSLFTYATLDRYQTFEGEYINNPQFAQAGSDWGFDLAGQQAPSGWLSERSGGDIRIETTPTLAGAVIIENADPKRRVRLSQVIDLSGQHRFELSAKVSTTAVVNGSRPWHTARIDFAGLLADGTRDHGRPHVLFDGSGTKPVREVKQFFDLDPSLSHAQLTLQLSSATGRFTISDLQLKPAAYDPLFVTMDKASRALWLAFVGIIAAMFWQGAAHQKAAAGAIALVGLGALLVLLPQGFRETLNELTPLGDGSEWTARAIHFLAFAAVAFLVALARRRERPKQIVPPLIVMAIAAEALQIVSGGLGLDDLMDLATNLVGVIVGCGIAEEHIKANYGRRKRKRRKNSSSTTDSEAGDYHLKQA